MKRRTFLKSSIAGAGGLALAGPLSAFSARVASADPATSAGYGPISPKAAENDGITYLSLPDGFSYWAFNNVGTPLSASNPALTPTAHDGMAAFAVPGSSKIRLVRNHENLAGTPFTTGSAVYDSGAGGGCTIIEFDPANPTAIEAWGAISGTIRNCAGGPTPWGTWLTCEETIDSVPTLPHGYVFEVPANLPVGTAVSAATPYKAMGRFAHEAAAVDPATNYVYMTEDAGATSGFYRFVPTDPGVPGDPNQPPDLTAGTLQMLAVAGQPAYEAITGEIAGAALPVEWVTIATPDSLSPSPYQQGVAAGGASFKRLEGCWWSPYDAAIYFTATEGGNIVDYSSTGAANNGAGQVWAYKPGDSTLTLVYESPGTGTLLKPDNLTVSPQGNVWVFEDPDRLRQSGIRGLADDGTLFTFATNSRSGTIPGTSVLASWDEFAGGTFSPDGEWLFVNIQTPGVTFAINGPFGDLAPAPVVPESPIGALLGASAAVTAIGAAIVLRNRGRSEGDGATPTPA